MAAGVRVRRPPSPTPSLPHAAPHSQRFPPRHGHLDADERREAASRGYGPGRKAHPSGGIHMTSAEWKLLGLVVVIAMGVRLFRLSRPNSIVFDEVHFGKFASKYIKSSYFVDVHPPLAKLLITLAGFVFGYDGNFDFKDIAKVYEGNVPYVAMRLVPALLGVATVPLAYVTLRALDCRATTALLASLFITFENGLITQSRHILLDSPLIFFTALTTFLWIGFCNEDKQQPFTDSWWAWLALTGLSLGATVSCKWVGLFTIATVGLGTLKQLWLLLGDTRVSARLWTRHFMARAICLIAIPITFYMFMFWLHFLILSNAGDGDGFMSSEFQHTLNGRGMSDTYSDVAYGSVINLRHVNTQGGYLHSHGHNYPTGSQQQQITLYPHRDSNNDWRIVNATATPDPYTAWSFQPFQYVHTGDRVKLRHVSTDHSLHSHDYRPPVSDVDFQQEVSAYGMAGFVGDANDDWIVEIHKGDKRDAESWKRVKTLKTQFRLRHMMTGCYLFSHKVKLPEWGFDQQEVTCNKNAVLDNSLWYIETNTHPNMPENAPKVNYKRPGFIAKFLELQQVMWTTNAGLTERHAFDSRPDAWPRLRRGINFWVKDNRQIYLLGNPLVWWLSTAAVVFYAAIRGLLILRAKRGYKDFENTKVVKYDTLCGFLFIGWSLHYFPFYLMGRQLFLHHYFPALYFAILLSCGVFDLVTSALRPRVRLQIAALLVILAIWNYAYLSPLAYGLPWTKQKCKNAQWVKTWDFSCNDFLDSYDQYNGAVAPTPTKQAVVAPIVGEPPVVQDNKVEQNEEAQPPEADAEPTTTSIPFGQAEPVRDIFAANEGNKPNSDTLPVAQREPEAAREAGKDISTDDQLTTESAQSSLAGSESADKAEAISNSQETVASALDSASTPKDSSQKQEVDTEAERVRAELFPDEAGTR